MASGNITRRERGGRVFYEVTVDLGKDPVTGKRRLRSRSFKTKGEARTACTAWQGEIDQGTAVDRSRQTVAEMLRYWLDTYARPNVRPRSYVDYEPIITRHIILSIGAVPVQKLTPSHVQQYYADKLAAGCGPRTVQLCHLRLKQALTQAEDLGLVSRNVADKVTPPRVTPKEMSTWDAAQARRFLAVAVASAYGPIWLVSLATGMRRGELLGLRWKDIDWERRVLSVRQTVGVVGTTPTIGEPKSKAGRRDVRVQPEVIAALHAHKRAQNEGRLARGVAWHDHDLMFAASNGKPIQPSNLRRDYERWVRQADVPYIRIHDQRHTHVTLSLAAGVDLTVISKRVGHARPSITSDIYAHVLSDQHEEAADKIGTVLFGAVAKSKA